MRKIIILILLLLSISFASSLYINHILIDPSNYWISGDVVYVWTRSFAAAFNFTVEWDNRTKTVVFKRPDFPDIRYQTGTKYIYVGDNLKKLSRSLVLVNGRTFLPLKTFCENVGLVIKYGETKKIIFVTKPITTFEGLSVQIGPMKARLVVKFNFPITEYKDNLNDHDLTVDFNKVNIDKEITKKINEIPISTIQIKKNGISSAKLTVNLSQPAIYKITRIGYNLVLDIQYASEKIIEKPVSTPKVKGKIIIVLDPGHGGKDPGASGEKTNEKTIVLNLAKRVRDILNKDKRFEVVMTRDSDKFIPLYTRAKIANELKANAFISFHMNACNVPSVHGVEIYYFSYNDDYYSRKLALRENAGIDKSPVEILKLDKQIFTNMSKMLAQDIASSMKKNNNMDIRHISGARFVVLSMTMMPSILIENGFITDPKEEAKFMDPNYLNKVAESIAKGIEKFFGIE